MVRGFRFIAVSILSILVFTIIGARFLSPAYAPPPPTLTLTASPPTISLTAGSSGSTTITFENVQEVSGGSAIAPFIYSCSGLPDGWSCSTNLSSDPTVAYSDGSTFTLTISTSSSTAPGTYPIVFQLTGYSVASMIQPILFGISPTPFTPANSGGLGPSSIVEQTPPTGSVSVSVIISSTTPIPEYPLSLSILAIFMILAYGVIRRRTVTKQK